ncbi:uncharacterized protein J4E84_001950 [Alternaria hordeiaustralica]|uniref:uncharacterized protein n=1 Tax=Alternaria hordeiaustralica TaxID=1187925 RepID=UPI0020C5180F|nr:uncharacterized protein J4E84_001950 [Alternaria hordeiaustralica]KAI4695324.1 hypothetical protein J4E84_001950 [Alternaria hordeiaustralica]
MFAHSGLLEADRQSILTYLYNVRLSSPVYPQTITNTVSHPRHSDVLNEEHHHLSVLEQAAPEQYLDAKKKDKISHKVKSKVGSTAKSALAKTKEKLAEGKAKKEAKKAEKEEGQKTRIDSVVD